MPTTTHWPIFNGRVGRPRTEKSLGRSKELGKVTSTSVPAVVGGAQRSDRCSGRHDEGEHNFADRRTPAGIYQRVSACCHRASSADGEQRRKTVGLLVAKRATAVEGRRRFKYWWAEACEEVGAAKRVALSASDLFPTDKPECVRTTRDEGFTAAACRRKFGVGAMRATMH